MLHCSYYELLFIYCLQLIVPHLFHSFFLTFTSGDGIVVVVLPMLFLYRILCRLEQCGACGEVPANDNLNQGI